MTDPIGFGIHVIEDDLGEPAQLTDEGGGAMALYVNRAMLLDDPEAVLDYCGLLLDANVRAYSYIWRPAQSA